jgi:NAD(P)-dependent dehydrogenase (short-subunit alcohol dehydrogenase family)
MGLELCKQLAKLGAVVSACDIQQSALDSLPATVRAASNKDAKVLATKVDVRDRTQVDNWIKGTVAEFGALHGAANFAGVIDDKMGIGRLEEQDEDQYNFVISVNLTGVMHCMRAQLQHMGPGASIVNASSAGGLVGLPGAAAYSASKFGVSGLTRTVAKEAGKRNIRVNAIAP